MSIAQDLSVIAFRQVVRAAGHIPVDAVVNTLVERFANHTQQLTQALYKSNDRAWQTLESALAGPSIRDFLLKRTDDRVMAEHVRVVLEHSQLKQVVQQHPDFCKRCLAELRSARKQGKLSGQPAPSLELVRQAHAIAILGDPQAMLDAEWQRVQQVAAKLQQTEYVNLARLLNVRPPKGSPILASSVRYFFRREVEMNHQLFQGLAFAKLEDISENQERMLGALTTLLTEHGQRFSEVTEQVLTQLGVIEENVVAIKKTVDEIKESQDKSQEQTAEWQKNVLGIMERLQLQNREVRPADSFSIRNDGEREMVRKLIDQYRNWPEEQRHRLPEMLNSVGKLELATGDFSAAQRDFCAVATSAAESKTKAEAHFNAYQASLEQKKWAEALASLKEAVALDAPRFAPFPFAQYEPQRILGAGGFGVVFLCKHPHLHRPRVIKSLRTTDLDRSITDVFSEARTLETLDHPSIIKLIDFNFADSARTRPFLVMDFFDGVNLENYVEAQGLLTPADLLRIAIPIAEALQAAHANGILHRDVKPGNVLVRREADTWHVKLIDFGLAIQPSSFESKASTQGPQARTMASQSIAGTKRYAAPEQLGESLGVGVGAYSDVYGFGKTCYYTLFSTPEPDDVEKDTLPDAWRRFLRECTAQRLSNRLPDFTAVLTRLRELASAKAVVVVPDVTPEKAPELAESKLPEARLFHLNAKGIIATGYESTGGFVVVAGSQAVVGTVPSIQESLAKTRNDLIQRQILVEAQGYFILKQNQAFASASAAASVMLGRNANGREEWKDADGRSLKAIQDGAMPPEERLRLLETRIRNIEKKIQRVERFKVAIKYDGPKEALASYDYERAANNDLTVAQWRNQRFMLVYPDCEVTVRLGDGSEAHGAAKLATVRESYR